MYLKRLELQGFKSFADKTILEFMPGITSVIGPNGSGKSNIADAIRWVLGEQSMKELRGGKTSDVIFAGTVNRKSLGFAEASLVFDNQDGGLPIEYQEVIVTRRIYRSGETGYFINKVQCRLKDISELFMDTGIGKDGYSIIGQGKIDEILSNKSEDRRNVFEEAVGIVKYRARKEESEKKLEHVKLNLLRINDIVSEIENNLEPLKLQADKANKYVDLKSELKNTEVGLFLFNIDKYKEELSTVIENDRIMQDTCKLEEGKIEKIKIAKEELKENIEQLTENIENTQNLDFTSKKEIEELNANININKSKIKNNEENKERFEEEIENLKLKIEKVEDDIKNKLNKKGSLKENKEKYEIELEQKQSELEGILKNLNQKELEIEEKKRELEQNTDIKYEIEVNTKEQSANIYNIEKRKNQIENEISNYISDLDNTNFTKEEVEKNLYEIQKNKNQIIKQINNMEEQKNKNLEMIREIDAKINKLTQTLNIKEAKHRFLIETEKEKEGYIKSVKEILKECKKDKDLGKGVRGAIGELISVPENIETSIEMALGGNIQNIVTDEEKDAKRLIEYLRNNNLGRATFLPINAIKGKKIEKIKGINYKVLGIAVDLVQFEKEYEQIMLNLLGKTVIVQDMETAIKLAKDNSYLFKIVTLDGDIVSVAGAMSGGSINKKNVKILGRTKEIENLAQEITILKKDREEIENQKEKINEHAKDFNEKYSELKNSYQTIDIKFNVENQKMQSIEENLNKITSNLNKIKQEKQSIENQKAECESIINENNLKIQEINEKSNNLKNIINEFSSLNKETLQKVDDLNLDITNLKISVSSFIESENSIDEIAKMLEQEKENSKKGILIKQEDITKINKQQEELKINITNDTKKIEEIKENVEKSAEKIIKYKENRTKTYEKLSKKEEEEATQQKVVENLKAEIVKLDVKKMKIEEDLNSAINLLWDEYEITPNSNIEYEKPKNIAFATKKANNLRQDIKELGSINIDSIEEYKNLKQRYDFMCEQRLDLENTMSKLRKMILDITENMKDKFKEKMKVINENFEKTFKELFGGGEAGIIIQDENNVLDCGIDIEVQPPGKKLQNMALLSGGERAFTAIALLFAILKMNPAPFCVLDEIEAALDDVNVNRYAEFLKKFAMRNAIFSNNT